MLHVGTNNLENSTKKEIASAIKALFEHINVKIIWSDILERVAYRQHEPGNHGKVDGRRRAGNSNARALAARRGGGVIGHPDIKRERNELYRPDGLHLSNKGLDLFIRDLKEGLTDL